MVTVDARLTARVAVADCTGLGCGGKSKLWWACAKRRFMERVELATNPNSGAGGPSVLAAIVPMAISC